MKPLKPCAAMPKGKNKGLKKHLEQGDIYGGNFKPVWGADKKGRSLVLVLRDDGDTVLAAPVDTAAKAASSPMHIKVPRGKPLKFAGMVLLDRVCSLDKKLLDRKMGELPLEIMNEVTMATFRAGPG